MGIADYYSKRNNPHAANAKAAGGMLGNSGFAKPLVGYMMGKELAAGQAFDEESRTKGLGALQDQDDRKNAMDMLSKIIEVSKSDAQGATAILAKEAQSNPHLASFGNVRFTDETKQDWLSVKAGDGQNYQIHLPALSRAAQGGGEIDMEALIKEGGAVKVGGPTEKTPGNPNFEVKDGDKVVTYDKKTGEKVADAPRFKDGAKRTKVVVTKDIASLSKSLHTATGTSVVDALLMATTADQENSIIAEAIMGKKDSVHIKDMMESLRLLKEEYREITGNPWRGATSPAPSPGGESQAERKEAQRAELHRRFPNDPRYKLKK